MPSKKLWRPCTSDEGKEAGAHNEAMDFFVLKDILSSAIYVVMTKEFFWISLTL